MPETDRPPLDLRSAPGRRDDELAVLAEPVLNALAAEHGAREQALPACRRTVRLASSAIRAVHGGHTERGAALRAEAEASLRQAQRAVAGYPAVAAAGYVHDAAKEYVEACAMAALVEDRPLPGHVELGVPPAAWLGGLAEAASELRRSLLDRLKAGDLARAERLLQAMDDVYDVLMGVDYPDALTGGLRRAVDALRAVLERSRGDITAAAVQARVERAIEREGAGTSGIS